MQPTISNSNVGFNPMYRKHSGIAGAAFGEAVPEAVQGAHLVQPAVFDAFKHARIKPEPAQAANDETARKASRMVSAFKIIGGGLGAGIVMSLLFGSPPAIAIGLSFAIGFGQHLVAEKIFKGKNPVSQKITEFCGMLVSHKPPKTETGLTYEDKCTASVWGAVTAATTVLEAVINLMLARKEKSSTEIREALVKRLEGVSSLKPLYQLQLKGFDWKEKLIKKLTEVSFVKNMAAKTAGAGESALVSFLKKYKKPLSIIALIPISWVSGYLQGIAASKLAKHTIKPQAQKAA